MYLMIMHRRYIYVQNAYICLSEMNGNSDTRNERKKLGIFKNHVTCNSVILWCCLKMGWISFKSILQALGNHFKKYEKK